MAIEPNRRIEYRQHGIGLCINNTIIEISLEISTGRRGSLSSTQSSAINYEIVGARPNGR